MVVAFHLEKDTVIGVLLPNPKLQRKINGPAEILRDPFHKKSHQTQLSGGEGSIIKPNHRPRQLANGFSRDELEK